MIQNSELGRESCFSDILCGKRKKRGKTHTDLFWKSLTISWKVFGELCFTAFCGQLQIWVMPCNQSLPGTFTEPIRGIRTKMLEAGSRMHRWAGETCDWFSGRRIKEQLDNSGTSPEPGSHPMSLKIKPGVCFLPALMAQRLYWLKDWDRIISLWLFYWLQGTRNNGYDMKLYCVWENWGNSQALKTFYVLPARIHPLCLGRLANF